LSVDEAAMHHSILQFVIAAVADSVLQYVFPLYITANESSFSCLIVNACQIRSFCTAIRGRPPGLANPFSDSIRSHQVWSVCLLCFVLLCYGVNS
jgi:hypothetical protein